MCLLLIFDHGRLNGKGWKTSIHMMAGSLQNFIALISEMYQHTPTETHETVQKSPMLVAPLRKCYGHATEVDCCVTHNPVFDKARGEKNMNWHMCV